MSMKQGTGGRRLDLRIATMSLIWGMLEPGNISKWLRESAEAGYDGVTGFESDFSPYLDDHELLADTLREHGLALAGVDWRMNEDEKLYRRYFELMKALDCALFVCIDPAGPKAAAGGAKDYAKLARSLNRVGSVAREYGITVHYHNHTAAVGETLTDMERLIDETDPELVGIMLDLGHATKDFTELAPPERAVRFLEQYWERLHYMELKDWNERTQLNTPLGEGHADYQRVFAMMKERGYSGWITVEQNGNDGASLGRTPLECAKISREFIRKGLGV